VPKNACRAVTTAVLWHECAEGYSGWFGVGASGCHDAVRTRGNLLAALLRSPAATGVIRWDQAPI